MRVFLLDDHEIVRNGIRGLLESDGLSVVGEAGTAAEALARIPSTRPDVAVLDVRLPDGNGIEVCREIRARHPEVACIMLTSYADDEAHLAAVMAGAAGYVLKQIRGRDLVDAVRTVAAGTSLIDPVATARLIAELQGDGAEEAGLVALTGREREILELISAGRTNREIGAELFLAEKTVKNYVSNLLSKLGMGHRSEAAAYAARLEERRAQRSSRGL
ncbi:MAG TPA: response regulator transcription factor [Acidimicrobiales bacterium]|jgi:two-component system response regulator DevR